MPVKEYSPHDVQIVVGGQRITGFTDGTFVEIAMDSAAFNKVTGSDGHTMRFETGNYAGNITLTLMQGSTSNTYLSGLQVLDRQSLDGVVEVLVRDKNGDTFAYSDAAWVSQIPNKSMGNDHNAVSWMIDTAFLKYNNGGNTEKTGAS